jgi:hypothetical protein
VLERIESLLSMGTIDLISDLMAVSWGRVHLLDPPSFIGIESFKVYWKMLFNHEGKFYVGDF